MTSFPSVPLFKDIAVLSPHYLPEQLPYREEQIAELEHLLAPAKENKKPRNLFIYGKTGTGKTCSLKKVMVDLAAFPPTIQMQYLNCRIYNSRYRVLQKLLKGHVPELEKSGFGLPFLYEKLIELLQKGIQLIVVLDEIDMVKDLDELVYTLTRVNDEVKSGGLTMVGISNNLSFKEALDPRSRSSLHEAEMVFPPYTSEQLQKILAQRAAIGFAPDTVQSSAINLIAAVTAQESGDARYALKLLLKAGEMAEQAGKQTMDDSDVEAARKKVEIDLAAETIATLPENHQLALYAIALLASNGSRYARLQDGDEPFLFSGETYEEYRRTCKRLNKHPRSPRWHREYLNDLEMLGLISTAASGKGIRGQTTLIRLSGTPDAILSPLKKSLIVE